MRMAILTAVFFLSLPSLYGITAAEAEAKKLNRSGLMELEKGNPGEASVLFRMALQRDPGKKHYYNNMAVSLMKTGSYNEAEKYLLKGISLDSNYTKALANMAVVLFHQRRFYESYTYYIRSKKTDPVYAKNRFKKDRVLWKLKDISSRNPEDDDVKKIIDHLEKE
jgi:Tfp pilus assembly protein PilF